MNINNVFWTFQGEGLHAGRRALFIRMPFCNLKCPWCDTEFNTFKKWTTNELSDVARQENARFAVITGGEPMMNKQTPIVAMILKDLGFEVACETNGMFPIAGGIDFATVSPKSYSSDDKHPPYFVCEEAMFMANEFKYVIERGFDFSILDRHDLSDGRRYSLSPEHEIFQESLGMIFTYIKEHPQWRISLQTHKIMNVP